MDILPILQIQLPSASNNFDCHDIREISIWIRGYADGTFEVKDSMGWRGTGDIRGSIYQCLGKVYRTGYDSGWNTGALPDLSR